MSYYYETPRSLSSHRTPELSYYSPRRSSPVSILSSTIRTVSPSPTRSSTSSSSYNSRHYSPSPSPPSSYRHSLLPASSYAHKSSKSWERRDAYDRDLYEARSRNKRDSKYERKSVSVKIEPRMEWPQIVDWPEESLGGRSEWREERGRERPLIREVHFEEGLSRAERMKLEARLKPVEKEGRRRSAYYY